MSKSWSTLTKEITQTVINGSQLHTLTNPSKIQSNTNLHQNKDNDFINRHHSVTFNRTSIYYGTFTIILLIIGTIIFLFYCGGMKKFLSHFKPNTNKTTNTPNILLQQNPNTIPTIKIQKLNPFNNTPFTQQNQPPHYTQLPTTNN